MTNAAKSGRFRIAGAFDVNRLGFGAMRIVGKGIWGPPADRAEVLKTLAGCLTLALTSSTRPILTARISRGDHPRGASPYGKIHVATKGGLTRTGPNIWIPVGRPEYLIQQAHTSRWRLGARSSTCGSCIASI